MRRIDPDSRLLRWWSLTGGVSAQTTGLEIERAGGTSYKLILRQHAEADRTRNPNIADDEFKLLYGLRNAGLLVPTPVHIDSSGEILPTPYMVMEYIDGTSDFAPKSLSDALRQLAATLVGIHRVDHSPFAFLPKQVDLYAARFEERPATLDESLSEGRIRAALKKVWPLPQHNDTALLHGDFWPGNVVWKAGELAAVIDWEDARLSDPLEDLGNTRLEILWAYGEKAMQEFTECYQTLMPELDTSVLPCWDLCAALRPASKLADWGLDAATENRFRERHRWFVDQAFERLGLEFDQ